MASRTRKLSAYICRLPAARYQVLEHNAKEKEPKSVDSSEAATVGRVGCRRLEVNGGVDGSRQSALPRLCR